MKLSKTIYLWILFILLYFVIIPLSISATDIEWGRQLGTPKSDDICDVTADKAGNCYIVGATEGDLLASNLGKADAFIVKYDSNGEMIWGQQFGTSENERLSGIRIDSENNIITVGSTDGKMGPEAFGQNDIFICKLTSEGDTLWIKQFGTSGDDKAVRVAIDTDDNYYICGNTSSAFGAESFGETDVFVLKLDKDGNQIWISQLGTSSDDIAADVKIDNETNIYFTGFSTGNFGMPSKGDSDAYLVKLNPSGETIWIKQFGTNSRDRANGIALNGSGGIYVAGWTGGLLGESQFGQGDAYLLFFDKDGNQQWAKQFGTENWDGPHGAVSFLDGSGDVLIGGCWGWPNCKGWMRRYNDQGNLIWRKEINKDDARSTCGHTVFGDQNGNCYHIGGTNDDLFAENKGNHDIYLVKLSDVTKGTIR